jgi:hypothetical protein
VIKPIHTSGEKHSTLELGIDYIFKLPFPSIST